MSISPDIFPFTRSAIQAQSLQDADFKDKFRHLTIGGILNELSKMRQGLTDPKGALIENALYQTAKTQAGTVIAEKGISPSERANHVVFLESQILLHPKDKRRLI